MANKKTPGRKPSKPKITAEDIVRAAADMDDETKEALADVLGIKTKTPEREPGQRRVVDPTDKPVEASIEIADGDPAPEKTGATFRSPYPGFQQVLTRSKKVRTTDDDFELVPPRVAEFVKGEWTSSDDEEADLMRAKIKKKRARGGTIEVSEIHPKVAELATPLVPLQSRDGITTETPPENLGDIGATTATVSARISDMRAQGLMK